MEIKIKEKIQKIKQLTRENTKKSLAVIFLGIYMIFSVIWNLIPFVYAGDISLVLFYQLALIFLNVPVVMITSIILTGRWRNVVNEIEYLKKLHGQEINYLTKIHDQDKEISVKTLELENSQETYAHFKSIEEFKRLLRIERRFAELKIQIAAIKGEKVLDSLIANEDWVESNDAIFAIEELKKTVQEECKEILEEKNDSTTNEPGTNGSTLEENSV